MKQQLYLTPVFILVVLWTLLLNRENLSAFAPQVDGLRLPSTPVVAAFPFSDDFEAGALNVNWSKALTGNGVVELDTTDPYGGAQHLFLGQRATGAATANLILPIDLTGQTDLFLDFWWRATGNTGVSTNGVYISDDEGIVWKKIADLSGSPERYSREIFNLASLAAANNVKLNDKFQIRLSFTTFNGAVGGYRVDNFRLTSRTEMLVAFPVRNSFELQSFGQGQYPQTTGVGLIELDTTDPYSGTQHLFLGQKTVGAATANLVFAIDLSGQADVLLDFWWRSTGNTGVSTNGIYISDDDGATWKKIANLSGSPERYNHELLSLASLAAANSLKLNEKFQIRFAFTTFNGAIGGYRIDDLRVTSRSEMVMSFPVRNSFELQQFGQGHYPQTTVVGLIELDTTDPYSGTKHLYLGQKATGAATANFVLAIDLTGQSAVFMDFWWRATGNTAVSTNGVYISDDDGATWKKIADLSGSPERYTHKILNVANLASINNLKLNDKFQISLFFNTFNGAIGGYRIDDLRIDVKDPSVPDVPDRKAAYLPLIRR